MLNDQRVFVARLFFMTVMYDFWLLHLIF
jgi:hypothetical protein